MISKWPSLLRHLFPHPHFDFVNRVPFCRFGHPKGFKGLKWKDVYSALQSQHHWYLQTGHVMWLHPERFSQGTLQILHCYISIFLPHWNRSLSTTSLHSFDGWYCLPHCPHIEVWHFSHVPFVSSVVASFITCSHLGFGHQRKRGFWLTCRLCLNFLYFLNHPPHKNPFKNSSLNSPEQWGHSIFKTSDCLI